MLAGTNDFSGSFDALTNGTKNFLGACTTRGPGPQPSDLHGQLDEFRVWKVQRTAEQIRENMHRTLTGSETGLIGLWNFDDLANPGRDASPGGHHGEMIGQATMVRAALPSIVYGTIIDSSGKALASATVEIHQSGEPDRRVTSNALGEYAFTIFPAERCDLFVTTGKLSSYRLRFQPGGEGWQKLDWTLTETQSFQIGNRKSEIRHCSVPRRRGRRQNADGRERRFDFANLQPRPVSTAGAGAERQGVVRRGKNSPCAARYARRGDPPNSKRLIAGSRRSKKATGRPILPATAFPRITSANSGSIPTACSGSPRAAACRDLTATNFENLTTEDGLLSDRVFNLWREPSGIWWFCTARGVSRYDPALASEGRRAFRNFTTQDGLRSGEIHAVTQTSDGTMWFAGNTTGLSRFDGEKFFTYPAQGDFTEDPNTPTMKMTAATNDVLWLGTHRGLIRFDGSNFVNVSKGLRLESGADSPDRRARRQYLVRRIRRLCGVMIPKRKSEVKRNFSRSLATTASSTAPIPSTVRWTETYG